jgi:signal transduction histidine kinase
MTTRERTRGRLRNVSRRLMRAQEDEPAHLARELHDDVTQRLAVLAIDVGRAELAATARGGQAATLKAVREGLVRLSDDIHRLAYQLHPSVLEELGLAEALRTECERPRRQTSVDVSIDLEPLPGALGRDAALCVYRVAAAELIPAIRSAIEGGTYVTQYLSAAIVEAAQPPEGATQ